MSRKLLPPRKQLKHKRYYIMHPSGGQLFEYGGWKTRRECIARFLVNDDNGWEYYRKQGYKCDFVMEWK